MASFAKDLKKVFTEIRAQDADVEIGQTRKGHWQVRPGDKSRDIVTLPGTPSDVRAWKNMIKQLERTGGYDLRKFRK